MRWTRKRSLARWTRAYASIDGRPAYLATRYARAAAFSGGSPGGTPAALVASSAAGTCLRHFHQRDATARTWCPAWLALGRQAGRGVAPTPDRILGDAICAGAQIPWRAPQPHQYTHWACIDEGLRLNASPHFVAPRFAHTRCAQSCALNAHRFARGVMRGNAPLWRANTCPVLDV